MFLRGFINADSLLWNVVCDKCDFGRQFGRQKDWLNTTKNIAYFCNFIATIQGKKV